MQNMNKDGISNCPSENKLISSLLNQKLIVRNIYYSGKCYSYRVLPEAPYLLRRLYRCSQKKEGKNNKEVWRKQLRKLMGR